MFSLNKKDNVFKYVIRRKIVRGEGDAAKTYYKSPKVQRLITENRIRRKRAYKQLKIDRAEDSKAARKDYEAQLSKYVKEQKAKAKATETKDEVKKWAS